MNNFRQKKSSSLDEMAKFPERHKLPKLTQEEIYNLNGYIIISQKFNF